MIQQFRGRYPQMADKIKLNHVLNSLTYGDVSQQKAIKKRFGATEHTNFDMMDMVDDGIYAKDE
jgi:hypothetical protein